MQRHLYSIGIMLVGVMLAVSLAGCGGQSGGSASSGQGAPYALPSMAASTFDSSAAQTNGTCSIDTSSTADGYAGASATSSARLKLQVKCGDKSYNYDLPNAGTPIIVPLNMGDGTYTFRIMQNTSGSNYVELFGCSHDVVLSDEFAPYVRPNVYCDYSSSSACVQKAQELASSASTQADVVSAVYDWIVSNVSYDKDKAQQLQSVSGYVPNPDEILTSKKGICFDYASLGAAMLRSVGIPCKIVTGYVAPDDIYHAWNMIYIDGAWSVAHFSVNANEWSRVDLTFAAADDLDTVGDGSTYTERYTY